MLQDWFPLIMLLMHFPVLLIHEYGHACAGRLVGTTMTGIYIGEGKPVISIGHVHWSPQKFWQGRYSYKHVQLKWGQRFLLISGGVLANLITGSLVWVFALLYPEWFAGVFTSAFVTMSFLFVIVNLFPHTLSNGLKNDGLNLKELWLSRNTDK